MKVTISIPAYNEEATISKVIQDIKDAMNKTKYKYKILVLNDGSTDKTAELSKNAGAIVISNERNLGLAQTFKKEMEECLKLKSDIIVHTDADGQYPAEHIPELIAKIEQGHDLVLGSRFGKGNYSGAFSKRIGNLVFARALSKILKTKITDSTTGFRAFTKEIAKLPLINNFTYTQEQLIRASREKAKITEIPIKTNKTRKSRLFKGIFDYAIKAWINIFRIYRDFEPLKFFGLFGTAFLSIGFIIGAWLVYLFITTGRVGHMPSLVLSALLVITGVQIVLFGFLADMYKPRT